MENKNRKAISLKKNIKVLSYACAGGELEHKGPLGEYIDIYCKNDFEDKKTWEQAETEMVKLAFSKALEKASLSESQVDIMLAGDLMNQCTGTGYGLMNFDIPYLGLYGACSTFAEGALIGSLLIESGHFKTVAFTASSHFCTAERQYRYPLEYGSFSEPTSQTTVTGAGVMIITESDDKDGIFIRELLPGIVCDRGIDNASNMGAAMAGAAADTIERYLNSCKECPGIIYTGDLGKEGLSITKEILQKASLKYDCPITDCGICIYDIESQDVGCGGSGCGCSALCTCGYIMHQLKSGEISSACVIGTGAMLSPQSILQGNSIPSVAHLIKFARNGE